MSVKIRKGNYADHLLLNTLELFNITIIGVNPDHTRLLKQKQHPEETINGLSLSHARLCWLTYLCIFLQCLLVKFTIFINLSPLPMITSIVLILSMQDACHKWLLNELALRGYTVDRAPSRSMFGKHGFAIPVGVQNFFFVPHSCHFD